MFTKSCAKRGEGVGKGGIDKPQDGTKNVLAHGPSHHAEAADQSSVSFMRTLSNIPLKAPAVQLRAPNDDEPVFPAGMCCRRPDGSSARSPGMGDTPVAVVTAGEGDVAGIVEPGEAEGRPRGLRLAEGRGGGHEVGEEEEVGPPQLQVRLPGLHQRGEPAPAEKDGVEHAPVGGRRGRRRWRLRRIATIVRGAGVAERGERPADVLPERRLEGHRAHRPREHRPGLRVPRVGHVHDGGEHGVRPAEQVAQVITGWPRSTARCAAPS